MVPIGTSSMTVADITLIPKIGVQPSETLPETTTEPVETFTIPSWVTNVADFWCSDEIDDAGFIEAVQYLIDNGIITVPPTDAVATGDPLPDWIKQNACWWSEGAIDDTTFANAIQWLVAEGIIIV